MRSVPGLTFLVAALLACASSHAHGGGLNSDGCHNDRKRGTYHCHRSGYSAGGSSSLVSPRTTLSPASNRDRAASPSRDVVFSIQSLLNRAGCNAGTPDGRVGAATTSAIERFQSARGLPVTGAVSDRLLVDLIQSVDLDTVCTVS